ncbi:nucleoside triphosphate pyrophosphohydrolase family protein [Rhizosphaericola mali]|uniref:MazG-like protein n=1 Tax=Rhizosphaericola mali TaxID=2545455 RepID=A0A5P2FX93_9BACT|nr:MazG-like protein [Rhizosphaericola mali]QES88136.1 MazG-like protein [Rhizosphaericola mali]
MSSNNLDEIVKRSLEIRKKYHELEILHHKSEWSIEEDALAYLTDAGLVGRNIMSQQKRWPKENSENELIHKIGENFWWLTILSERSGINIKDAIDKFLDKTEQLLK